MIIPQDKVDKTAYDNTESMMYSHNSMETRSMAKRLDNAFKAGVKFAESELEGISIRFGRWILKNVEAGYDKSGGLCWVHTNEHLQQAFYTTQEVFKIFLENDN